MTSSGRQKIHVIGAGLAGAALAVTLAEDGHDVTLYDSNRAFSSRWTRNTQMTREPAKIAEPEIFYDPDNLVADFFAQWPDLPDRLIRPAHAILGISSSRRSPSSVNLDPGVAKALIRRRHGRITRIATLLSLWFSRYSDEEKRVNAVSSFARLGLDDIPPRRHDKLPGGRGSGVGASTAAGTYRIDLPGGYHQAALEILAEILFSVPAVNCSRALLARVIVPIFEEFFKPSRAHCFAAIDPILLNDIALPTLRDKFIAAGGKLHEGQELTDIDSTPSHATELFFGEMSVRLRPDDAVVLALHPRPLGAAVPDIGMPQAPARRRTFVFQANAPFAEPRCVLVNDDFIRAIYCNRRQIQISLSSSLVLPDDTAAEQYAEMIWERCVALGTQFMETDLSLRGQNAAGQNCPEFSYVDCDAPFPELTPGVAALRHRMGVPWRNLFLCGDVFAVNQAPGPAAAIASVRETRQKLQQFLS